MIFGLDYYKGKDGKMRPQFPRNLMMKLHLRWICLTILTFSNWLQIYLHRFFSGDYIFRLWNGLTFTASVKEIPLPVLVSVYHYKEYGDLKDIPSNSTVIDIGAHIGAFTILALSKVSDAKIYAYEPSPNSFEYLKRNIKLNGFNNRCVTVQKAVAGKKEMRTFYMTKELNSTDTLYNHKPGNRGTDVQCVTLEDVFKDNNISRCDLLKLDAEGAEYEILLNTPDYIMGRVKKIVMEWHLIDPKYKFEDLENFLSSNDFSIQMDYPSRSLLTATNKKSQ